MRRRLGFLILGIIVFGFTSKIGGGELKNELKTLHREIGNNLIKIKKEYPKTQDVVYSVLDQLGKYYSFSKKLISKKKEYKKLFKDEVSKGDIVKKELAKLKERMGKVKKVMIDASDKLKKDSEKVVRLKEEKEALAKEKELFEVEKQALISQRDSLLRERDALVRERDAIAREKDMLEKGAPPKKVEASRGTRDERI